MTWLRHASRHVHATVLNYVRDAIIELDWTQADSTLRPFGDLSAPVVFTDEQAITGDGLAQGITAGVVACTLGTEFAPEMEEMGGALASQEYPIFFDVFQASEAVAVALANDIRDILMGRLENTRRWLPLINQINGAEVVGWRVELDEVERDRPERNLPLHWQVVRVTATAYFPEVRY